ncbi:MAG: DUF6525 family protein [Rhizobiaceae bacterium]
MSNCTGSYRITEKALWAAFDALPQSVRERLSHCSQDWVPASIAKRWKTGRITSKSLIEIIDKWEKEEKEEHFIRLNRAGETGMKYETRLTKKHRAKFAPDNMGALA